MIDYAIEAGLEALHGHLPRGPKGHRKVWKEIVLDLSCHRRSIHGQEGRRIIPCSYYATELNYLPLIASSAPGSGRIGAKLTPRRRTSTGAANRG